MNQLLSLSSHLQITNNFHRTRWWRIPPHQHLIKEIIIWKSSRLMRWKIVAVFDCVCVELQKPVVTYERDVLLNLRAVEDSNWFPCFCLHHAQWLFLFIFINIANTHLRHRIILSNVDTAWANEPNNNSNIFLVPFFSNVYANRTILTSVWVMQNKPELHILFLRCIRISEIMIINEPGLLHKLKYKN